ncbi:hypothetical protein [Novosphingobium sp. Fuku2-ISO-50]|uniref:hypothetical protein n=1 Tax=Novosphingobium sp. Fuku2-ISO-50 TaxID=1739114 RepID=UPI0012E35BB7|nr:hypothetical protein [Novosphingobium sp. Fuku2-ISO-50]
MRVAEPLIDLVHYATHRRDCHPKVAGKRTLHLGRVVAALALCGDRCKVFGASRAVGEQVA